MFQKGHPKFGGREKGTPNKNKHIDWLHKVIEDNQPFIEQALQRLALEDPKAYIQCFCSLLQYVVPKKNAIAVEAQIRAEYAELGRLMQEAPAEAVAKISDRVLCLMGENED